jgi:hypothetical protein
MILDTFILIKPAQFFPPLNSTGHTVYVRDESKLQRRTRSILKFHDYTAMFHEKFSLPQKLLNKRQPNGKIAIREKKTVPETVYSLKYAFLNLIYHVIPVSRLTRFMLALELSNDVRTGEKCEVA